MISREWVTHYIPFNYPSSLKDNSNITWSFYILIAQHSSIRFAAESRSFNAGVGFEPTMVGNEPTDLDRASRSRKMSWQASINRAIQNRPLSRSSLSYLIVSEIVNAALGSGYFRIKALASSLSFSVYSLSIVGGRSSIALPLI